MVLGLRMPARGFRFHENRAVAEQCCYSFTLLSSAPDRSRTTERQCFQSPNMDTPVRRITEVMVSKGSERSRKISRDVFCLSFPAHRSFYRATRMLHRCMQINDWSGVQARSRFMHSHSCGLRLHDTTIEMTYC